MGRGSGLGIDPGDTFEVAMLSPCVGGHVRTWTDAGSRLWSVPDASRLSSVMARGLIARTLREEGRFREVALLNDRTGMLLLQPRTPIAAQQGALEFESFAIQLGDPVMPATSAVSDLKEHIGQAVRFTVAVDGFLLVERGGWDAPSEPYCLFVVVHDDGDLSLVEAAPAPVGAPFWAQNIAPGAPGATMSAPATAETLAVVPALMIDACATWGLEPWDLAITYGTRS